MRLSKASVGHAEIDEIRKVFEETVNFGLGVHVSAFENQIKQALHTDREVVCVNSGTSALHIALESLCFTPGSEVIVPSLTFLASFSSISAAGLMPVACDVLYPSGQIDIQDMQKRITSKTVAIMPVAYGSADFDRSALYRLAQLHKLRVIEDDAHAFGGKTSDGRYFGDTGDVICFSFDGIKNITCGEGGAVVTADVNLAHAIRVRRSLGIEKDVELRYKGERAWEFDVAVQGYRYHMSNINAAIGIAQLRKLSETHNKKNVLFLSYVSYIEQYKLNDFLQVIQPHNPEFNYHIFPCLLRKDIDRAALRAFLLEEGIQSGIHYVPNHFHTMYATSYRLPVSEDIGARTISLPFHPDLRQEDSLRVIQTISKFINSSSSGIKA